jgi:hypothetical protein
MNKSVLVTGSSRGIGLTLATSRFLFWDTERIRLF